MQYSYIQHKHIIYSQLNSSKFAFTHMKHHCNITNNTQKIPEQPKLDTTIHVVWRINPRLSKPIHSPYLVS